MAKYTDLPIIMALDIFLDDEDREERAEIAVELEKQLKTITFSKEFVEAANGVLASRDRVAKLEDQLTGRQDRMEAMQGDLSELNEKMSLALESGDDSQVEAVVADIRKLEGEMDRLQPVLDMLKTRTIPAAKEDQEKVFEEYKSRGQSEFRDIYDRREQQVRKAADKLNHETLVFQIAVEDAIKTLGLSRAGCTALISSLVPGAPGVLPTREDPAPAPVEGDYLGLGNQV